MAEKEKVNELITEAQAKAAGITEAQADGSGGYQKAYTANMGKPEIDDEGNLSHDGKIIAPDGTVLPEFGAKVEKGKENEAKTAKTEYKKRLKVVEDLRKMSLCPGWQARNNQILATEASHHEDLVEDKVSTLPFHQAMVQSMRRLQSDTWKLEIESLNNLSARSGELPLYGEGLATAKYIPKTGEVEITYPEVKGKKEATK